MLSFLNRRAFLLGMVTAGAVLLGAGLLGCGGSGASSTGAFTEANLYPLRGYYEGTYTRSLGDVTRTGIAQLRIMGLEDRQPAVISGDIEYSPAIEPGMVQGFLDPAPNPHSPDYEHSLLGGQMTTRDYITIGFDDGLISSSVVYGYAEGTLSYDPETKTLTGTFPVTSRTGSSDSAAADTAGTISFILVKKS